MRTTLLVAAIAVALALAACGGDDDGGGGGAPTLTVSAATSLKKALTAYGDSYDAATVRYSFAGSDELAAQIRQGVKPDVYAAANTKLPDELYAEGLVEKPQVFAGNELVIAVPAGSTKVTGIEDLQQPGISLVVGDEEVPVGSYTRTVLDKLPAGERDAILANVKSEEPDVGGVVGKLTQGAADAGFVYASDVKGAGDALEAIELPAELEPQVSYGVAVVKGAKQPEAAKAYIDELISGAGQVELTGAGFLPPPGQ